MLLRRLALAASILLLSAPAPADEPAAEDPHSAGNVKLDSGRSFKWLPQGDLYSGYVADPHRNGFGFRGMFLIDDSIEDAGDTRAVGKLGGRFGLVRMHPEGRPDLGWQVSFDGGFEGLFDVDSSLDNIGWDGTFGWYLNHTRESGWSIKFAWTHISSHLGDEYIESTGRLRIDYTRREWLFGASRKLGKSWRVYGEIAYGVNPGNDDLQEPGRWQAGFEYDRPRSLWGTKIGWYSALDLQAMEERSWRLEHAYQLGFTLPAGKRTHRAGLEYYDGRALIAEFFQKTESYVAIGLWLDIGY